VLVYTWKSSIHVCACFWWTLISLTCPVVSVAVLHVQVVLNSTVYEVNSTVQYPRRFNKTVQCILKVINQPVKSEGTRYFFLSKSPILALGAFSTMTFKLTKTKNSASYMYTRHVHLTCKIKFYQSWHYLHCLHTVVHVCRLKTTVKTRFFFTANPFSRRQNIKCTCLYNNHPWSSKLHVQTTEISM